MKVIDHYWSIKKKRVDKMLLTIDNAKTSKGEKLGYLTGILYMLPNEKTCPFAKNANCLESCLVTAGLAGIYKSINEARKKRVEALKTKKRIAVVFRKDLPITFLGRKVIDGDSNDLRFLDPSGVIVGLKAKGKAIQDYSGFVVDPEW